MSFSALSPFVFLLLLLVVLVLVVSITLAFAHRITFRIAMRNVRRGRWRTVLVILGLLVATTIVSGSLVVGDTVSTLETHFVYLAFGYTDEAVTNTSPTGGYAYFPVSIYAELTSRLGGYPLIAGIAPEVVDVTQVLDLTTHIPQVGLTLIGANSTQTGPLGPFTADNGTAVSGPAPGAVLLDDQAAEDLGAHAGDAVLLFGKSSGSAVVQAIVHDDTRGGFLGGGNVFVDLPTAQRLTNASGLVNFLAVTNVGSLTDGVAHSTVVSARLNATLAAIGAPPGLASQPVLQNALDLATAQAATLSTFFLVLGLFSIVAGGMLIIGIFVMLAEERKGEMGMLRAVGLRRRQLTLIYYFEGLAYSAGSAVAGALLGIGVAYGLTYAFTQFIATSTTISAAILASFTVTLPTLFVAYVVGFFLTLLTTTVASYRASRLNIVRAIRSIPEPTPTHRFYTGLAYFGLGLAATGGAVYYATAGGTGDVSLPLISVALILLGIALVAARWVSNRIAFSAGGVGLVVYAGWQPLHRFLFGTTHSGTIFVFFLEGIFMVLGAVVVYIFNAETVVRGVARLMGHHPRRVSVAGIGLSYPSRKPFRTAINLTIFALVLFTVVSVATFGDSLQKDLDGIVQANSGGYTFFGASTVPIPDIAQRVQGNATLAPLVATAVPLIAGGAYVAAPGGTSFPYLVFSAPVGVPASQNFYSSNRFNFSATLPGLSGSGVWSQLATNHSVAVVDGSFEPGAISFLGAHPRVAPGGTFRIQNPSTGAEATVEVIAVMTQQFVAGIWVSPSLAATLGYQNESAYFLGVTPGTSAVHTAQLLKTAFFAEGLVLFDFAQLIQSALQQTEAVIGLLEIFTTLGLGVGIAAMGIVALRAVVERRSEVGMLRATGFTRGMVLRSFLLEYSYVALLGIAIGTSLGLLLIWDATQATGGLLTFSIPWANLAAILGISYALTIAAVIGPSLKASRLPPAEAIRYSE